MMDRDDMMEHLAYVEAVLDGVATRDHDPDLAASVRIAWGKVREVREAMRTVRSVPTSGPVVME